jgi:NADP-dependent 3-hydroxy acid dehydrogenase YdfG
LKVINETELADYPISKTSRLAGCLAVVTGASGGIGRAITLALAREGVQLCVVGRNPISLADTVAAARKFSQASSFEIDLTVEENLKPLLRYLEEQGDRVDILIHSAGVMHQDPMACARIEDLDLQYATNIRAPYLMTQRLLPLLTTARGQIVFINSSVGLTAKRPKIGQYSATKHALKAIADSVREEVNPKGIRVLTIFLGRTATPMQEVAYQHDRRDYHPEFLLQPEDIATMIISALSLPRTAEVTDISMRPMQKSY